ncbi:EcsC family protein [Cypionkella sp.]|uniref:EcsC family protein n=1 Tax=Cypionkella sp. TaxID=2811411 RepID=UPI002603F762|nr:EcsC family protein [Cypionkella sp.]MDB5664845.1 protein EcsC [Cypionkella sp.]
MAEAKNEVQVEIWPAAADAEIAKIAQQYRQASGLLMKLVNYVGGKAENALEFLPDGLKDGIESATAIAMQRCYEAASSISNSSWIPSSGTWTNKAVATLSGAVGGLGGLPSTLAELPFTVTTIFTAIQKVAMQHGFDPQDPAVKLECLAVLGSGGPLREDDSVELSYLSSRLAVNGTVVQAFIARYAPKLALVLSQKLAAQMVPVLGAVAGAGLNYTFISYFEEMAQVRFKLRKMAEVHGAERVAEMFRLQVTQKQLEAP